MFKYMKKIWGTALLVSAFSFMNLTSAFAQTTACVTPPSCEDLGYVYSTTQCTSGILKCPFDTDKVFCTFETKVGDILYSDMSSSPIVIPSKKPIGVIFDMAKRLAIGLDHEIKHNSNSNVKVENVGLVDGKLNTQLLVAYAKENEGVEMPAADYCFNYSTLGTNAGDWFLMSTSEQSLLEAKWAVVKETMDILGVKMPAMFEGNPAQPKMFQNSSQDGTAHYIIIGDMYIKAPQMGDGYPTFPVISF